MNAYLCTRSCRAHSFLLSSILWSFTLTASITSAHAGSAEQAGRDLPNALVPNEEGRIDDNEFMVEEFVRELRLRACLTIIDAEDRIMCLLQIEWPKEI